jgi:Arc/MetJ family transcription regulator
MIRRTTIEIDDELLERAKRALGSKTARAAVEEALRRAADTAENNRANRRTRQLDYLQRLGEWADLDILASEEMWR